MKLNMGPTGGMTGPGAADGPDGRGHPLNLHERVEIMCGLRQGLSRVRVTEADPDPGADLHGFPMEATVSHVLIH